MINFYLIGSIGCIIVSIISLIHSEYGAAVINLLLAVYSIIQE